MADRTNMPTLAQIVSSLRRLVTQPVGELSRAQRALRFWVDLSRHGARELARNHATQMAAALTYRTIFSLIPITVLMLLVFRAFGGFEQVSGNLQDRIFEHLGLTSIVLPAEASPSGSEVLIQAQPIGTHTPLSEGDPSGLATQQELRNSIANIMTDLTAKASGVSVGSIGVVGLAVLIWAALGLLITLERSLNQIFNCSRGRSWHLRVPIYWAVITLGPVLLFVSLYVVEAVLGQIQLWVEMGGMPGLVSGVAGWLGQLMALGASWLLLFLLYVLMPNTRVRLRPALMGGLVAAVLWELGKWGFKLYVTKAVSYSTLYGSLGLVPLFLLWLYLTWLIVLFGMEITYTLQAMRGNEFEKAEAHSTQRCVYDPRWLVPMMARIVQGFQQGESVDAEVLSQDLGIPLRGVIELGDKLRDAGLIHHLQGDDQDTPGTPGPPDTSGYILAKPPEEISVKQLLELGQAMSVTGQSRLPVAGWAIIDRLMQAQQDAVGDITVAKMIVPATPGT